MIVNPNQPGCGFASKNLAGVGVMFYVLALRAPNFCARGAFDAAAQPRLDALLDLVALGTVADVVQARRQQPPPGRAGPAPHPRRPRRSRPGGAVRRRRARRRRASAFDFGFALGPRINAAGRLADMTLGIECLLTDDASAPPSWRTSWTPSTASGARLESGMREAGRGAARCADAATATAARAGALRPRLPRGRGRHRRGAAEGSCTAPPSSSRAGRTARSRARGAPFRLPPARRARSRQQAPPGAALRRPRHGRRRDATPRTICRAAAAFEQVAREGAGRRHAGAHPAHRRPRSSPRSSGRHGARAGRARLGTRPSSRRCLRRGGDRRSAWSASAI